MSSPAARKPGPGNLAAVPLRGRSGVRGALLTGLPARPGGPAARREDLLRLSRWAREAGQAVVVLAGEPRLGADLRALGFEDSGPLPRYSAPVRPGRLRRVLTALLLPSRARRRDLEALSLPLEVPAERALRIRLAPGFGVVSDCAGAGAAADPPPIGAHVVEGGEPVAAAVLTPGKSGAVEARSWIAPPGPEDADVTAALAEAALAAARKAGATRVFFETPHAVLARGLLLARILPAGSRARVLVRRATVSGGGGDRPPAAPRIADWHLEAPARVSREAPPAVIASGVPPARAAIV